MRHLAGLAAFLGATIAWAQPSPNPDDLYKRVRERVLADITRLPNYTCVQTITRSVNGNGSRNNRPPLCGEIIKERKDLKHDPPVLSWDRMRVDVAIVKGSEVYSWVGADKFDKTDVRQLVSQGQTSTGEFGSLVLSIFSDHPTMHFAGERKSGKQTLFEYTYQTPERISRYQVKVGFAAFTTAYEGSVFLDPDKNDLVRLTAKSAQLPEQTGYCQSARELDYGREHIRSDEALIPKEARVWVVNREGMELLNVSSYSTCHEYVGESVLRFDDPDKVAVNDAVASPAAAVKPSEPVLIPAGVPFDARIVTPIDTDTAAMGDPIQAVLRSSIVDRNGTTLAPAGASLRGRLMYFAGRTGRPGQGEIHEIGIQFRWIELTGEQMPFAANLAASQGQSIRLNIKPGVGLFVFNGKRVRLDHIDAKWITMPEPSAN